MNRLALIAAVFFSLPALAGDLPDPQLTPGALSPDVVRNVTVQELCTTSTKLVRNVPESVKKRVYDSYHMKQEHRPDCTGPAHACTEMDHDCSLEHGCNNDPKNLWPQAYDGTPWNAHVKDKLENELHKRICSGKITIKQAQTCISTDWIACYQEIFK